MGLRRLTVGGVGAAWGEREQEGRKLHRPHAHRLREGASMAEAYSFQVDTAYEKKNLPSFCRGYKAWYVGVCIVLTVLFSDVWVEYESLPH